MKKKTAYLVLIITCIVFSSFRKECNNPCRETSVKKDASQKVTRVKNQAEWDLFPRYNYLDI